MSKTLKLSRILSSLTVAGLLTATAAPALAGNVPITGGHVTNIMLRSGNFVTVVFDNWVNQAACAAAGPAKTLVFDVSTARGQAALNIAHAAMLANRTVIANGSGTCTTVDSFPFENLATISESR